MAVSLSSRIGRFEVISPIGAGGMGEVFRVLDPRIGREAAVKVLPAEYAHDSARLRRFEQEARAAGSLSHPNLVTIYELGTHDEAPYIAMELLEGSTLREKLRDPLPTRKAIEIAMQIANGLAAAHDRGIVHRDIKPENIFLTYDGQAKILDFGIAKLRHPPDDTGALRPAEQEASDKVTGTAAYMSPQQIRNDPVDHRSDIFSLGAVLYEMLSGRPAFHAATTVATMNAILHEDPPPLSAGDHYVSLALERIVRRCLEKEPDHRFDSARDVVFALEAVLEVNGATVPNGFPAPNGRTRLVRNLAFGSALIVMLGVTIFAVRRDAHPQRSGTPSTVSYVSMEGTGGLGYWSGPPAFSKDGTTLAFVASDKNGRNMLWVRPLNGDAPRELANTENSTSPFWSADGRFIGFFTQTHLKKISRDGGPAEIITRSGGAVGGTWNRDNVIVYVGSERSSLLRIPAIGGDPVPILTKESIGATALKWPTFLPDGIHILFVAEGPALEKLGRAGIWVATIDHSERPRFVARGATNMAYVEPGWLLTTLKGSLRGQRFDIATMRVTGDPVSIAPVMWWDWNDGALFAASVSGLLIFLPNSALPTSELILQNDKGEFVRRLARGFMANPRFSPDGKRVAVDISEANEAGSGNIWILGRSGDSTSRLTFDPANETAPVWSPDGSRIAYRLGVGDSRIAVVREGERAEMLIDLPYAGDAPTDWCCDARYVALVIAPSLKGDVVVFDVRTKKITAVAATVAHESAGVFSPDGRWIAYQSDENGGWEVYVQPFPPTGAKYQVSYGGGHWPRWRSPHEILYVDETNHLESVQVKTSAKFMSSPPRALPVIVPNRGNVFWSDYDVARDGAVVVNSLVYDNPPPLTLLTNLNQRLDADEKK